MSAKQFSVTKRSGESVPIPDSEVYEITDGVLAIRDGGGGTLGVFAAGEWLYALAEDVQPVKVESTREPRVWDSVFDIPPGTEASSEHRSTNLLILENGRGWWKTGAEPVGGGWILEDGDNTYGPFTEVIE